MVLCLQKYRICECFAEEREVSCLEACGLTAKTGTAHLVAAGSYYCVPATTANLLLCCSCSEVLCTLSLNKGLAAHTNAALPSAVLLQAMIGRYLSPKASS